MTAQPTPIDSIREDFAFLDDWEDRYRYVIELGKTLPPLATGDKTDHTRVHGCASQVWLTAERNAADATIDLGGESDAMIVQGLIAILIALYSGRTAEAILDIDAQSVFDELGLADHLTQQRANGLASMVERIRAIARTSLDASAQTAARPH